MKYEELKEQAKFVRWCREQGHKTYAPPKAFTRSGAQINDNTRAGFTSGWPDVAIVIYGKYRANSLPKLVFVEMKRCKGGITSPKQREWIDLLRFCEGVSAQICNGFEEAKAFISRFIEKEVDRDLEFNNFVKELHE